MSQKDERMPQVNAQVSREVYQWVTEEARRQERSIGYIVRSALEALMKRGEEQQVGHCAACGAYEELNDRRQCRRCAEGETGGRR